MNDEDWDEFIKQLPPDAYEDLENDWDDCITEYDEEDDQYEHCDCEPCSSCPKTYYNHWEC